MLGVWWWGGVPGRGGSWLTAAQFPNFPNYPYGGKTQYLTMLLLSTSATAVFPSLYLPCPERGGKSSYSNLNYLSLGFSYSKPCIQTCSAPWNLLLHEKSETNLGWNPVLCAILSHPTCLRVLTSQRLHNHLWVLPGSTITHLRDYATIHTVVQERNLWATHHTSLFLVNTSMRPVNFTS